MSPLAWAWAPNIRVSSRTTRVRSNGCSSSSRRPASILLKSRMSLTTASRSRPASRTEEAYSCSSPSRSDCSSRSVIPRTAFSGVRISWIIVARNSARAEPASSASARASSSDAVRSCTRLRTRSLRPTVVSKSTPSRPDNNKLLASSAHGCQLRWAATQAAVGWNVSAQVRPPHVVLAARGQGRICGLAGAAGQQLGVGDVHQLDDAPVGVGDRVAEQPLEAEDTDDVPTDRPTIPHGGDQKEAPPGGLALDQGDRSRGRRRPGPRGVLDRLAPPVLDKMS